MIRFTRLFVALASLCAASILISSAGSAQGLRYFYCYAVDPGTEQVLVSDMHEVGPVAERAAYGEQFATWLKATGKASNSVKPYCVMRASEAEIERGRSDLTSYCSQCGAIKNFRDVAWLRQGKGVEELLQGKLIRPADPELVEPGEPVPPLELAAVAEPVVGEGVSILGRRDMTDVVYAANVERSAYIARQKADLKGGKWTPLLTENRCPGWISIAYASNGAERWYFIAQGADSEGEASGQALAAAQESAKRLDGTSVTGVLVAFRNNYMLPPVGIAGAVSEDVVQTAKGLIRRAVTTGCPGPATPYATTSVRG